MKKLLVIVLAMFGLVGCSDKVDIQSFDKDMESMKVHMESFAMGNGDYEAFEKDVKAFDEKLKAVDTKDEKVERFVEYQLKANESRLHGVKNMDSNMITDSSEYQYLANSAYTEIQK